MSEDSEAGVASAAASRTGAVITVPTLSPACAAEQIEHAWCDEVESSGWLCTAWATPMAHTSAIESTHTTLVNRLRLACVLTIFLGCCGSRLVALDDFIVKPLSAHTIPATGSSPIVSFREDNRPAGWSVAYETSCNSLIIHVFLL